MEIHACISSYFDLIILKDKYSLLSMNRQIVFVFSHENHVIMHVVTCVCEYIFNYNTFYIIHLHMYFIFFVTHGSFNQLEI